MVLSLIVFFLTQISPELLLEQYRQVAEKNLTVILGPGELKYKENVSGQEYYLYHSENSTFESIVVFSSAKGRIEFFDYMIILNPSFEILNIKILKYRSEYGYEISNKGWLKQFYHKPYGRFEYKKDIDALSGASFSAKSLVDDVNQILDHLKK